MDWSKVVLKGGKTGGATLAGAALAYVVTAILVTIWPQLAAREEGIMGALTLVFAFLFGSTMNWLKHRKAKPKTNE